MKKRILTGPAIVAVSVVIGIASVFAITPADIERGQNKVVPVSAQYLVRSANLASDA